MIIVLNLWKITVCFYPQKFFPLHVRGLMACLDEGGEGGGVEGSRVVLVINKLILC